MTIRLPSETDVRAVMDQTLEQSERTGRRPTIANGDWESRTRHSAGTSPP
jgi:hypothetical protein